MSATSTHAKIVEAADQLFYQRGYEKTSFSDIANHVGLSRGNFYYHFKTKDDILDAVIEQRLANTRRMLDRWEAEGNGPRDQIIHFIDILVTNRIKIKQFGCPVGTLCSELAKLDHPAQGQANQLLTMFRVWLRRRFTRLGCGHHADQLAMHLLARSQGIATIANTLGSDTFIKREVTQMRIWLDQCIEQAQPSS